MQAALKLVLEPIFEVDFQACSYGFRPGRRTQDALAEIQHFTFRSYEWIVEGDIEACFDRTAALTAARASELPFETVLALDALEALGSCPSAGASATRWSPSSTSCACRRPRWCVRPGRTMHLGAKLDGMSSRGQSLSMFVVQRTFTRVLRGYDPDEVDRHLELVSQWFTSTDAGRAFARAQAEIVERERAVEAREAEQARSVEGARMEADATLEGAQRRAAGIIRDAEARAGALIRDAEARAAAIEADARREAQRILDAARADSVEAAETLRAEAEEELRAYTDRRRREADRLAEAARRKHRDS